MRDPIDEIREALAHPDFLERIDAIRGYDVAEKRLLDRLQAAEKERDALRAEIEALRAEVNALLQNDVSVQPELVAVALATCDAVDDLIEKWYATRESGCLPNQVVRAMGASKLLRMIALEAQGRDAWDTLAAHSKQGDGQ